MAATLQKRPLGQDAVWMFQHWSVRCGSAAAEVDGGIVDCEVYV